MTTLADRFTTAFSPRSRALAWVVLAVALLTLGFDLTWHGLVVLAAGVVQALAALLARTRPLTAVLLSGAAVLGLDLVVDLVWGRVPPSPPAGLVLLVTAYALGRWGRGRQVVLGCLTLVVVVAGVVGFWPSSALEAVGGLAVLALLVVAGRARRWRAAAREAEAGRVRTAEREHLARELHDTVAHRVTGILLQAQAGAAGVSASTGPSNEPSAAVVALGVIEEEARRTLEEMRELVGALRASGTAEADVDPPLLTEIDALARRSTGAHGTASAPDVVVVRGDDGADLPPAVQATLVRVARESVANAVQHARGARTVHVEVTRSPEDVRLVVRDDGAHPRRSGGASAGHGITGMSERVRLLGGVLVAGPRLDRGWEVRAVVPLATAGPRG